MNISNFLDYYYLPLFTPFLKYVQYITYLPYFYKNCKLFSILIQFLRYLYLKCYKNIIEKPLNIFLVRKSD